MPVIAPSLSSWDLLEQPSLGTGIGLEGKVSKPPVGLQLPILLQKSVSLNVIY